MKKLIYLFTALLILSNASAQSGIITTVVGNGMGNGYPVNRASFVYPNSVAIDKAGNIYICDGTNQEVRVIDAISGIVSSYAGNGYYYHQQGGFSGDGGPAINAEFRQPESIVFDTAYNLYICDDGNHRIRRVSRSTGIITTIAGNGSLGYNGDGIAATSASLNINGPTQICLDDSANIIIADQYNNRIRKVSALTGIISTIVGNGFGGYNGDGGPAINAELYNPSGVAFDTAMNLYITDISNLRIRRVDVSNGIITTICGNGVAHNSGDGGPASSAEIGSGYSISIDKNNNLYFADYDNYIFRTINLSTGIINHFAGSAVYYNGEGLPAASTAVNYPGPLYFAANGDIYIPNSENFRLQKIDHTTGLVHTIAGGLIDSVPALNTQLFGVTGFEFDTYGNMYITENRNSSVRKYNPITGMLTVFAGTGADSAGINNRPAISAPLCDPTGIAIDANNNIYLTTYGVDNGGTVQEINGITGIITNIAGDGWGGYNGDGGPATASEFQVLVGLTVNSIGTITVSDVENYEMRNISGGYISDKAGNYSFGSGYSGDGGPATSAEVGNSQDLYADKFFGDLYLPDQQFNIVRKVTNPGIISTFAGNGVNGFSGDGGSATSAELRSPWSVAEDNSHNIYVSDEMNHRIRKINYTTNIITTIAGDGTDESDGIPATSAEIYEPQHIAFDPAGNLYLYEYETNRIRMISFTTTNQSSVYSGSAQGVSVFPNPSTGVFQLSTNNSQFSINTVEVYNVLGEKVFSFSSQKPQMSFDLTNQPNGIYFYRVVGEDGGIEGEGKLVIAH